MQQLSGKETRRTMLRYHSLDDLSGCFICAVKFIRHFSIHYLVSFAGLTSCWPSEFEHCLLAGRRANHAVTAE